MIKFSIKLGGKKLLEKFLAFFGFFIIGLVLSAFFGLIFGTVSYLTRDKKLIAAICWNSFSGYSFPEYFIEFTMGLGFAAFVISAIILRKSLFTGLGFMFLLLEIPLFVILLFFSSIPLVGWETQCIYAPLIDTGHSETFNPYNVPQLEIGMSRDEVLSLIGKPLWEQNGCMSFTEDGACPFGDFAWYVLYVYFENGKVVEIYSSWMDD